MRFEPAAWIVALTLLLTGCASGKRGMAKPQSGGESAADEPATPAAKETSSTPAAPQRSYREPCREEASDGADTADETRRRVFETTCGAALWFDGLFGEAQHVAAARSTSGRIEVAALGSEFEGAKVKAKFHLRFQFPNLEQRLHAFFGRDQDDDFVRDRNEGLALRSQFSELESDDRWVAGLGYALPGSYRTRTDIRVGARGSSQPEVFVQGRFRANLAAGERNLWHFRETIFWTNRDGFGATTGFDFDRVPSPMLLFRWGNAATFSEATDGVDWRSALVVYQNLGERRAIAYEAFVRGETEAEVGLREYGARSIFRHPLLGKSWLFGELVVGYSWPQEERDQPREGSATVGVGVELLFGRSP